MNKYKDRNLINSILSKKIPADVKKIHHLEPPLEEIISFTYIAEGVNASVYLAIDNKNRRFAIRLEKKFDGRETHEKFFELLSEKNRKMAPILYYVFKTKLFNIYVMDLIYDNVFNLMSKKLITPESLESAIECLLDKKYIYGFVHGDMHTQNLVVLNDGKTLAFIDFDFSMKSNNHKLTSAYNLLDTIPLIKDLIDFSKNTGITDYNRVTSFVLKYIQKVYNVEFKRNNFIRLPRGGMAYKKNRSLDFITSYYPVYPVTYETFKSFFPSFQNPNVTK